MVDYHYNGQGKYNIIEYVNYDRVDNNKTRPKQKKTISNAKSSRKRRIRMIVYIAILSGLSLIAMFKYAMITELNYSIDKYASEYNVLKEENIRLRAGIRNDAELNRIKEIAETRLGMRNPDKHQIVYVSIPKKNYTKTQQNEIQSENTGILTKSRNIINSTLNRISKFWD